MLIRDQKKKAELQSHNFNINLKYYPNFLEGRFVILQRKAYFGSIKNTTYK